MINSQNKNYTDALRFGGLTPSKIHQTRKDSTKLISKGKSLSKKDPKDFKISKYEFFSDIVPEKRFIFGKQLISNPEDIAIDLFDPSHKEITQEHIAENNRKVLERARILTLIHKRKALGGNISAMVKGFGGGKIPTGGGGGVSNIEIPVLIPQRIETASGFEGLTLEQQDAWVSDDNKVSEWLLSNNFPTDAMTLAFARVNEKKRQEQAPNLEGGGQKEQEPKEGGGKEPEPEPKEGDGEGGEGDQPKIPWGKGTSRINIINSITKYESKLNKTSMRSNPEFIKWVENKIAEVGRKISHNSPEFLEIQRAYIKLRKSGWLVDKYPLPKKLTGIWVDPTEESQVEMPEIISKRNQSDGEKPSSEPSSGSDSTIDDILMIKSDPLRNNPEYIKWRDGYRKWKFGDRQPTEIELIELKKQFNKWLKSNKPPSPENPFDSSGGVEMTPIGSSSSSSASAADSGTGIGERPVAGSIIERPIIERPDLADDDPRVQSPDLADPRNLPRPADGRNLPTTRRSSLPVVIGGTTAGTIIGNVIGNVISKVLTKTVTDDPKKPYPYPPDDPRKPPRPDDPDDPKKPPRPDDCDDSGNDDSKLDPTKANKLTAKGYIRPYFYVGGSNLLAISERERLQEIQDWDMYDYPIPDTEDSTNPIYIQNRRLQQARYGYGLRGIFRRNMLVDTPRRQRLNRDELDYAGLQTPPMFQGGGVNADTRQQRFRDPFDKFSMSQMQDRDATNGLYVIDSISRGATFNPDPQVFPLERPVLSKEPNPSKVRKGKSAFSMAELFQSFS